ncbi:hypothetical protein SAY86_029286 [Trapa natans]|uniref:Non-specific lipid-transfer protein n=1 Tax=Trapa natans TaxID=22666 RepID=A0AAN7MGQ8_TRANT|nr:hypothetical protein SAY86_029286 [Trapa natans]
MAKIGSVLAMFVLFACLAMTAESVVSCAQVASCVAPCLGYMRNAAPLTPACCNGVRALKNAARTTADRQSTCRCLKAAAGNIRGVSLPVASGLPGKCGVQIAYKISPSTDCNKVKEEGSEK